MDRRRFEDLADELASVDPGLPRALAEARELVEALRERAREAVEGFRRRARERGADHLARIEVSAVEPDEKHVNCVQFRVSRGRWELLCVARAREKVTLVGPFKRGKIEGPCEDHALLGPGAEKGLEEALVRLIRQASTG